MTNWTDADLVRYGDAQEVRVAGMRRDGSLRTPVIAWVVRVDDQLYTNSVNGPDAAWFRGDGSDPADDDLIDAAYQRKYGRYTGPVRSINSPTARSTTLKLVPHQSD